MACVKLITKLHIKKEICIKADVDDKKAPETKKI